MIHFPSTTHGSLPRRSDSLNATQQKPASHKIFLTIEEELHDARRVHSHGQEEDLRLALNMLIDRLSQLSSMLSEAYKTQADLEVQLNVAKSNLQLVISNNEMLEDALKRDTSGHARDVGWRRSNTRDAEHNTPIDSPVSATPVPTPTTQESSRFFKFRFTGSSPNPNANANASGSRPGTPVPHTPALGAAHHLNSPSLPVLPLSQSKERDKELEELEKELEKERKERKKAREDKEALEAELEALSQALFEEANKMVATERIRLADTQDELREARLEKEALRSALRLLEGENVHLRSSETSPVIPSVTSATIDAQMNGEPTPTSRRTSSQLGVKSLPGTRPGTPASSSFEVVPAETPAPSPPESTPTTSSPPKLASSPPKPASSPPKPLSSPPKPTPLQPPQSPDPEANAEEEDTEVTPQFSRTRPPPSLPLEDPWADVPSKGGLMDAAAAAYAMR
ncbi:hypothetical protein Hypma_003048 [Hypsizygus marmoreus]|uniref:GDP/GTP exchange factor Sec2 N-terminal domain-containing protein n=1 Tax=Hypsizygus marmoreus TaxID=39966 RepID=A0A369J2N4_HYPMA|nr:hypothetical protein Hypma_003048 [Hypsizygus marmoreus]